MNNSGSIEIDRSIEDVFVLTNRCVEQWSSVVVANEVLNDIQGEGGRFRCVTEENGTRMEFEGIVTEYDPPHFSAVAMTSPYFDLEVEYKFERLSGATRVTQTSHVKGKGVVRILLFFTGWLMCRSNQQARQRELENLKMFCEEFTGPLP